MRAVKVLVIALFTGLLAVTTIWVGYCDTKYGRKASASERLGKYGSVNGMPSYGRQNWFPAERRLKIVRKEEFQ